MISFCLGLFLTGSRKKLQESLDSLFLTLVSLDHEGQTLQGHSPKRTALGVQRKHTPQGRILCFLARHAHVTKQYAQTRSSFAKLKTKPGVWGHDVCRLDVAGAGVTPRDVNNQRFASNVVDDGAMKRGGLL